jgi:hypothetical protein
MEPTKRRFRILRITPELFIGLFTQGLHPGYLIFREAIPDGARIRNVRLGWPDSVELVLESDEFEEVTDGDPIPLLTPVIERVP